jgi:hypothetical protein
MYKHTWVQALLTMPSQLSKAPRSRINCFDEEKVATDGIQRLVAGESGNFVDLHALVSADTQGRRFNFVQVVAETPLLDRTHDMSSSAWSIF